MYICTKLYCTLEMNLNPNYPQVGANLAPLEFSLFLRHGFHYDSENVEGNRVKLTLVFSPIWGRGELVESSHWLTPFPSLLADSGPISALSQIYQNFKCLILGGWGCLTMTNQVWHWLTKVRRLTKSNRKFNSTFIFFSFQS